MTTFRFIIRSYADLVSKQLADADLTKEQAHLCGVLLNLAANHPLAGLRYPLDGEDRAKIEAWLRDFSWDAVGLFRNKQKDDYNTAFARAMEALKAM